MKALAIDCASPCMTICAENDGLFSTKVLDIGMHQSERILPEIQTVLQDVKLTPQEIQFACLCKGPGTFTGLRLAYSALKGIQLSFGFPIYAFDSLETYALPFFELNKTILSCIDAKKKRFYASVFRQKNLVVGPVDEEITSIKKYIDPEEEILLTGPDANYFAEEYQSVNPAQKFIVIESKNINSSWQLLKLGNLNFEKKQPGIKDFEGPVYIRPSEAEEAKLNKQ
jgi:tRNA threonylcarbamoyladenosine biosynthesis protein TsaB